MKTIIKRAFRKRVAPIIVVALAASRAFSAQFFDDFEGYSSGTSVNALGGQWGSYGADANVTNLPFTNMLVSTLGVDLAPEATVTNGADVVEPSLLWTECWFGESNHVDMSVTPVVDTNAAFFVGLTTNGYLYLYNPALTNWEECATDAWGDDAALATSLWTRITIALDFANHRLAFFVNDRLIRERVSFINTNLEAYSRFQVDNGRVGHAFMDEVLVSNVLRDAAARLDLDLDGRPETDEVMLYGDATSWNGVAVTGQVATPQGTVSPSGLLHLPYRGNTNFTFAATGFAYVVDYVLTNDVLAVSNTAALKAGSFAWSNIVNEGSVLEVHFRYDGTRYVPAEYGSITGALAEAQAGDRIVVSNGAYAGSLVLSSGVALIGTNMTGSATNLTVDGTLTVETGSVSVASGAFTVTGQVTVAADGVLAFSNTVVSLGGLTIGAGASVQIVNGTLTANGVTVSGTFTLDENWGASVKAMPINFTDGFESYGVGSPLASLMSLGWGASSAGVIVTNPASLPAGSTRAVLLPADQLITNRIDSEGSGLTNVWTDFYISEAQHVAEVPAVAYTNGGPSVLCYIDTNGWLVVFNRDVGGWDICSNAVSSADAPRATDTWARVTWFQNFETTNAAFFLNGILVREQVPFVDWRPQYGGLKVDGGSASLYLDSVKIWTNRPSDLTSDGNNDHVPDADEIVLYGMVRVYPCGSIFKIR